MGLEMAAARKLRTALLAPKLVFLEMASHVGVEATSVQKPPTADLAHVTDERVVGELGFDVFGKYISTADGEATPTYHILFTCVNPHVSLQVAVVVEGRTTQLAYDVFLTSMDYHVRL